VRTYKFLVKEEAVLNLARGVTKFTPIGELNDPTEMTPIMSKDAVRESLQRIRRDGYSEEQFKWLQRQAEVLSILTPRMRDAAPKTVEEANALIQVSFFDNFAIMESLLHETVEIIRQKVGVLCLSARFDSLPMWSHYADQASGFVVVFRDLDEAFSGNATGSFNTPKEVQYVDEFIGMTFDPSTQDRLFFSKLRDWWYEREWRVVCPLADCKCEAVRNLYLRTINPKHVEAIIFGWRVSSKVKERVVTQLEREQHRIKLIDARLEQGRVRLHPALLERSLSDDRRAKS
jgi:hypothetical protein